MRRPRGLWNRNFVLLWQGQLVSQLGDAVYRIAIGFWILTATGSTAWMGALMATSLVPRVVLSPLFGTFADRTDRRWLLVLSDTAAGAGVLLLGVAAAIGIIEVWMVFVTAVLIGTASALFDPAATSAVADLVPRRRLGQANAALAMLATGAAVVGNSVGGFFYQAMGAALLFVANGASYLASAASELFIRIPAVRPTGPLAPIGQELRAGLRLVWNHRGLRALYLLTAAINVCTTAAFVLLLPMCHRSAQLGVGGYGLLMGSVSVGALAGFLGTSAIAIEPRLRFRVYVALGLLQAVCFGLLPQLPALTWMLPVMVIAGATLSVQDALLTTVLQLVVPADTRGKAFGFRATLMLSLGAVAMVGAGGLAELMAIDTLLTIAAVGMFAGAVLLAGSAAAGVFHHEEAAPPR